MTVERPLLKCRFRAGYLVRSEVARWYCGLGRWRPLVGSPSNGNWVTPGLPAAHQLCTRSLLDTRFSITSIFNWASRSWKMCLNRHVLSELYLNCITYYPTINKRIYFFVITNGIWSVCIFIIYFILMSFRYLLPLNPLKIICKVLSVDKLQTTNLVFIKTSYKLLYLSKVDWSERSSRSCSFAGRFTKLTSSGAPYKTELCPNLLHGCTEGEGWGRGGVFIVNGREMSWPAATCAYGDASIDNRDLALIARLPMTRGFPPSLSDAHLWILPT